MSIINFPKFLKNSIREINNHTISGTPIIEGKAKLIKFIDSNTEGEFWEVLFPGENESLVQRFIPYNK